MQSRMIKKIIATPQLKFIELQIMSHLLNLHIKILKFLCTHDEKTALGYEIP